MDLEWDGFGHEKQSSIIDFCFASSLKLSDISFRAEALAPSQRKGRSDRRRVHDLPTNLSCRTLRPAFFLAMPTRASTHAIIRFHSGVGRDAQATNEKRADLPIDVQKVETRPWWSTGQLVLSDAITAAAARTAP